MQNKRDSIYNARFWLPDKIPHYLNVWLFKTNNVTGSGKYVSAQANPSGVTLRIIVAGQWHISTRGKDYQARCGDVFLACPGEKIIFSQPQPEADWEWLEIQLNGSRAAQFAGQFGLSLDNAVITPQAPEKSIELFSALHEHMGDANRSASRMLALLFELINAVGKEPGYGDAPDSTCYRTLVARALDHLETMPDFKCNVSELAAHMNIDRTTLNRAFKTETGFTAHARLDALRYMRACELLTSTAMSLESIATRTGFSSMKYFISWFKKNSGSSPGKWRRQQ